MSEEGGNPIKRPGDCANTRVGGVCSPLPGISAAVRPTVGPIRPSLLPAHHVQQRDADAVRRRQGADAEHERGGQGYRCRVRGRSGGDTEQVGRRVVTVLSFPRYAVGWKVEGSFVLRALVTEG